MYKKIAFRDARWIIDEPLVLQVQGGKRFEKTYFQIDVVYDNSYEYKNLHFLLKIERPDSSIKVLKKNLHLFDNYGKPIGKGLFSDKKISFVLNDTINFGEEKDYYISLSQHLRVDTLAGIKAIQLQILPSKKP